MAIETFIVDLADAVEVDPEGLTGDTRFDAFEGWDSLSALSTIAMIYATQRVQISAQELVACETIGDLYAQVQSKVGALKS